ncbi:MAG: hypothetical protein KDC54_13105, partial [Lewinella sp.]|nr:hypothetical protein [Lewinella sp.]
ILIALRVNNWNNSRLDRQQEQVILQDIFEELAANGSYLAELQEVEQRKAELTRKLLPYFGETPLLIVSDSFYRWAFSMGDVPPFSPKNSVLTAIMNTGTLELIQDKALRYALTDYQALLRSLAEDYQYRIDYWKMEINPYFIRHISSVEAFRAEDYLPDGSRFPWPIEQVLADPHFENLVTDVVTYAIGQVDRLQWHMDHIEEIRAMITSYRSD